MKAPEPQELTVKDLIPSVTKVSKALGMSPTPIYTWITTNSIPPKKAFKLANVIDRDIGEFLHLVRKASVKTSIIEKTKDTLPVLIRVAKQELTTDQAAHHLGISSHSVKITLTKHTLEELINLKNTLDALEQDQLTLDQAANALGITKHTLHQLRKRYGYAPPVKPAKEVPEGPYKQNIRQCRQKALDIIAGKETARHASRTSDLSLRSIHRHLDAMLRPRSLNELSHWSLSARGALAWEVAKNRRKYIEKWREIAENAGIPLRRLPYMVKRVKDFRKVGPRYLLFVVLNGEMTLEEVADVRGGEPTVIKSLFNQDLAGFETTFSEVMSLSVHHQLFLAEVMAARMFKERT